MRGRRVGEFATRRPGPSVHVYVDPERPVLHMGELPGRRFVATVSDLGGGTLVQWRHDPTGPWLEAPETLDFSATPYGEVRARDLGGNVSDTWVWESAASHPARGGCNALPITHWLWVLPLAVRRLRARAALY
jgi:hypothetical protein